MDTKTDVITKEYAEWILPLWEDCLRIAARTCLLPTDFDGMDERNDTENIHPETGQLDLSLQNWCLREQIIADVWVKEKCSKWTWRSK